MKTFFSALTVLLLSAIQLPAQYLMENLGRGVVAIRQDATKVYLGWRMLGTDPAGITFNLYRSTGNGAPILLNSAPLAATTDFIDSSADLSQPNGYFVRPIIGGIEQLPSATFTLPANAAVKQYLSIPLQVPPGGVTPSGEAYTYDANDASVGDLDGDGEYEIVLKWDPSNSKDNSQSGYTGNVYLDAYRLDGARLWRIDLGRNIRAGAHYTQFMVYDLDGDGKAEVACKTADGAVDGTGKVIGDATADYRNYSGYILSGPEYLTIFNGQTGAELATTDYFPARGNVADWGDNYGNRVDRFLAAIAYLDGHRPSLVMCRGYYTRAVLVAWNWRNGVLSRLWTFDSNDGTPGNSAYQGQGNHNLSVGDIDGDGKQEIVYGAAAIDHDGKGLYSTGWGHGDAGHLSDLDPDRPGLEFFQPHEVPSAAGAELRDARTGALLWGATTGGDNGRGLTADIDPTHRGFEMWTGQNVGLWNVSGTKISSSTPPINFAIWWDADPLRELLDGTTIYKWNWTTNSSQVLLSPSGVASNNGTKATPCLSADILGDWREEVVWRAADNSELRIYTTTIPATSRLYTLMHDPQYRVSVAWQNVSYNQPPHPGFYLGADMQPAPTPDIVTHMADLTRPTTPIIQAVINDAGASATDRITSDSTLVLTGVGGAGTTVMLREVGTGVIGSTTIDGSGNWTFDYSAIVLSEGSHYFTAAASDGTGAVSGTKPPFQVVIDRTAPAVTAIMRLNPSAEATSANTVIFRVAFSERVSNVTPAVFAITTTGSIIGTVSTVSAVEGSLVDVTVSSIIGMGTLRLDIKTASGIIDIAGNPLSGGFTAGQSYTFITPTWTRLTGGGLWSDPASWSGGVIGDGLGLAANFNMLDLTADNVVHVDKPITIGTLIFGDAATATPGSWILDNNGEPTNVITLAVTSGSPTLMVNAMGSGSATKIATSLAAAAGFTKNGAGVLALAAPNALSGPATINAGILRVVTGGILTSTGVSIASGGAQLNVAGGTFAATGTVNITPGSGSGVYVDSGTALFNTITTGNSAGGVVRINGGTVTANSINFPRSSDATPSYSSGLIVTVGTIGLGTNNSYGVMSVEGGTLTVTGMLSVGNLGSNSNRGGVMRVIGGTFNATDAVNGIIMSQKNNNSSIVTFSGGISSVEKFTMGFDANVLQGMATLNLNGGTLYLGSGGIVKNGAGAFTANVNLAPGALGATLGAKANWSSSLNMTLSSSLPVIIKAADAAGAAHDITLSGILSGTGGLGKSGTGALILSGVNTYIGTTTIDGGTMRVDGSLSAANGQVAVNNGGTLAGSGVVSRLVALNIGGAIAPGGATTVATLTVDSVVWNGGKIQLDLGATSDLLIVNGALTKGRLSPFIVELFSSSLLPVGSTYTLIVFGTTDFSSNDLNLSTPPGLVGSLAFTNKSLQFTVIKNHLEPPVLTLPADLVIEATGHSGAVATYKATANDAVDGVAPVSYSIAPGTIFPLGTTVVTVTASDLSGNVANGTFTVTVRDTTAPTLTLPANQILEATSPAGAVTNFIATASDIVDGDVPVNYSQPPGSTFPLGVTTVTVTATDRQGNIASGTFTVMVRDTKAPMILSLTAKPNLLWPANGRLVPVVIHAGVSDIADAAPKTRIISVTSNEPPDAQLPGRRFKPDWRITGDLTLQLRAERSERGNGRIYTITVESRDASGNASVRMVTVLVPKHGPPHHSLLSQIMR